MSAEEQLQHDIPCLTYTDERIHGSDSNIGNWTNVWSHDHPAEPPHSFTT